MEKPWLKSYPKDMPAEINPNDFESLVGLLENAFKKYSAKPAFSNFGKTLTFKDMEERSRAFAAYLQSELGLVKGDRLAIMLPNVFQFPIALFGALRAGLVVVNVNPLYTGRELSHQLNDSGAKAIVILANVAHVLESVVATTSIEHVIVTQVGDQIGFPKGPLINFVLKYVHKKCPDFHIPGARQFNSAIEKGRTLTYTRPTITLKDTAFLQYTGGTTGIAKGAVLSHGNICANVIQASEWIHSVIIYGQEIIITALPMYHIFSLTANCMAFTNFGAHNILITNPRDFKGFVKELKKWPYTIMTGVNTLYNALLNTPGFSEIDHSHCKVALGGGMSVQEGVAKRWHAATGHPLIEAYGLTETSPAVTMNPLDMKEYNGCIGLPIPSTEIVILGPDDQPVPMGEPGELCVRGPQVMKEYWNRPEESAKAFTKDGYFRTGDLATMDPNGYLRIVDRLKDMILVSGFNVYPNEVEEVASLHPGIVESAAVGVADEKHGQIVKLYVVKKDQSLTEASIIEFCRESLTAYKVPKIVEFRLELPKTNVGKILRRELRDAPPA